MKDVPFNPRRPLLVRDWVKRHSGVPQSPSQNVQHVVGYWNVIACLWIWMNGIACKCCYKISSQYHAPFKLPSLITKGVRPLAVITSYTITLSYMAINTSTIISAASEIMTRLWRECLPNSVFCILYECLEDLTLSVVVQNDDDHECYQTDANLHGDPIVFQCTPKRLAMTFWKIPYYNIPIVRRRSFSLSRGNTILIFCLKTM